MKRPIRNTTLYLRGVPSSLVRELKAQAARRGVTLTALAIAGLTRALTAEPQDELKPLEADMAWYEAHRHQLLRRYAGEYLAIVDRKVLDHDLDFNDLAGRVFAKVGVRPIFMPRCVASDQIVRLRSPHRVSA